MTGLIETQPDTDSVSHAAQEKQSKARARNATLRAIALTALLSTSAAIPLGVWIGAKNLDSPIVTTPRPTMDVVPVTSSSTRIQNNVNLESHVTSGPEVTSSDSGRITWLAPLGASLADGDKVAVIDNRDVLGYTAKTPLWRDLGKGAKGPDVKQLQELLARWGYLDVKPDGMYGMSTVAAVVELNKDLNRDALKGQFSLASVAWLGTGSTTVEEISAPIGSTYSAGDPLFKGPSEVAWISVSGGPQQDIASGKTQLTLPALAEAMPLDSATITDRDVIDQIAPQFGDEGLLPASVELLEETPVKSVPASALVTGPTGETCVYDGESHAPISVTSIGGGNSTVTFAADFPATSVIANPGQLEGLPPCTK